VDGDETRRPGELLFTSHAHRGSRVGGGARTVNHWGAVSCGRRCIARRPSGPGEPHCVGPHVGAQAPARALPAGERFHGAARGERRSVRAHLGRRRVAPFRVSCAGGCGASSERRSPQSVERRTASRATARRPPARPRGPCVGRRTPRTPRRTPRPRAAGRGGGSSCRSGGPDRPCHARRRCAVSRADPATPRTPARRRAPRRRARRSRGRASARTTLRRRSRRSRRAAVRRVGARLMA
jgi:hypothetical protein